MDDGDDDDTDDDDTDDDTDDDHDDDDTDDDNDHKNDSYTAAGAAPGVSIISIYIYGALMGSRGSYLWGPMGSQGPGTHGPGA